MEIFVRKTIFHLFGILLIIPILNYAQDVKSILSLMPSKDKEALTRLFYWMMHTENLSYTLFGDKPVSLSGDFIESAVTPLEILMGKSKYFGSFEKNWQIWEKYEEYFLIENYLLIKEPSITVSNTINVVLINKKEFINIVNQHIDIFKQKLGRDLIAENLLKKIESGHQFASTIRNDEVLWGILLGYGIHNAKLYDKKYKLERFIYFDEFPKLPIKKPSPSQNFSSIEEELDFLKSKIKPFGEYGYSPIIQNPVHFMVDPGHPETKALKKKYQSLRSKISAIYARGDFLEITFSKLTSSN
jgi:hypothetical protein